MIDKTSPDDRIAETPFGKRKLKPRACIVDSKQHVQSRNRASASTRPNAHRNTNKLTKTRAKR